MLVCDFVWIFSYIRQTVCIQYYVCLLVCLYVYVEKTQWRALQDLHQSVTLLWLFNQFVMQLHESLEVFDCSHFELHSCIFITHKDGSWVLLES